MLKYNVGRKNQFWAEFCFGFSQASTKTLGLECSIHPFHKIPQNKKSLRLVLMVVFCFVFLFVFLFFVVVFSSPVYPWFYYQCYKPDPAENVIQQFYPLQPALFLRLPLFFLFFLISVFISLSVSLWNVDYRFTPWILAQRRLLFCFFCPQTGFLLACHTYPLPLVFLTYTSTLIISNSVKMDTSKSPMVETNQAFLFCFSNFHKVG